MNALTGAVRSVPARCAVFSALLIALSSPAALGGENPDATFVLHAQSGLTGSCTAAGQPDCITTPPNVNIQPNGQYRVFFYLNNISGVQAVQTAFQWDPSWDLLGSSWSCQVNPLTVAEPDPDSNGGPASGALSTAFDCVTGPGLVLIGHMDFQVGSSGCLTQVNPVQGSGRIEVVDCQNQSDEFDAGTESLRLGRICVDSGGQEACAPPSLPVGIIALNPPLIDCGDVAIYTCNEVAASLRNDSLDPQSVLRVTGISISGAGFGLVSGPTLPVNIPGGSAVPLAIRFCSRSGGVNAGTLTVTASNASNSPHQTPLAARTLVAEFVPEALMMDFASGALAQPAPDGGPLSAFQFTVEGLRENLEDAGVFAMQKLLPWFTAESVHTTNALGEEVLLDDMSRVYVAALADGSDVGQAIDQLRDEEGIGYVGPDFLASFDLEPNDPIYQDDLQWGLHNNGSITGSVPDIDINAPEAWDRDTGGGAALVAIIDSGVDLDHEDLVDRLAPGYNFANPGTPPEDDLGHGTAVAGIAGATGNNPVPRGVVGVNWRARLVPLKVSPLTESRITAAIDYTRTNGIPIASLSLGGPREENMYRATRNAALAGTFLVAAMGNNNNDQPIYPAAFAYVFAVGALWLNGDQWVDSDLGIPGGLGSNRGNWIDVSAPGGRGIATTKWFNSYYDLNPGPGGPPPTPPVGSWDAFGGTSAATPFVSGSAGLLADFNRNLIGDDFAEILRRTAEDRQQYGIGYDVRTGFGLIRIDDALDFVAHPRRVEHVQLAGLGDVEQFTQNHTFFGAQGVAPNGAPITLASGTYPTTRHRMRGTFTFQPSYLAAPITWYRTSGTIGWTAKNPYEFAYDPASFAVMVDGTLSSTSVSFDTFVFEVRNVTNGQLIGWFPTTREGARIALTAVGNVSPIAVEEQAILRLSRVMAAPNPGVGGTSFLLDLPNAGKASLRIYDLGGRLVRILSDNAMPAGSHVLPWDGRNSQGRGVSGGVYFWQLDVNGERIARDKIVISR